MNRLKQIGLSVQNHESQFQELPPGTVDAGSKFQFSSWMVSLLPFVEQNDVFGYAKEMYDLQSSPFRPVPHFLLQRINSSFSCDSDPWARTLQYSDRHSILIGPTSYLGVAGTSHASKDGTLFYASRVKFRDILDGLSNTILVGERPISGQNNFGWWYAGVGIERGTLDHTLGVREIFDTTNPLFPCQSRAFSFPTRTPNSDCDAANFWSYHPGGGNFLLADGSVAFFSYEMDNILDRLATRAGHEVGR